MQGDLLFLEKVTLPYLIEEKKGRKEAVSSFFRQAATQSIK